MYTPKHFITKELVDKETYELLGENALKILNQDLLRDLDTLREELGKSIIINNWHIGGMYSQRGFRSAYSRVGGLGSQHRLGNAFDLTINGMPAEEVRQFIIANKDKFIAINRLESDVSWVHLDCKSLLDSQKRIYLFKP